MTTVQITLPDRLARDAEIAGLLSSDMIQKMLRERLRVAQRDELFAAMDRMADLDEPAAMSPEEVAAEMAAYRSK